MLKSYFNLVLKKPLLVVFVLITISALLFTQLGEFELDASSDSLVLENDADLRYYREVMANYKSNDYLVISYSTSEDLLNDLQLRHLKSLRDELRKLDLIANVTTILDVPLFRSPPLSLMELKDKFITLEKGNADRELARKEFKSSPIYSNNLMSKDGKTTALLLTMKSNTKLNDLRDKRDKLRLKKYKENLTSNEEKELKHYERQVSKEQGRQNNLHSKTIADIRGIMDKYRSKADLFLGGLPMIVTDVISYIESDLLVFSLGVIIAIAIVLGYIFRSWRWILLPVGISLLGAFIMTSLLGILDWKVTVISSNFFSLLLVMSLAITIHLIVRFLELSNKHPNSKLIDIVKETMRVMFKPCLFTTLTTVIAFSSLLVSGIRPVIDFGWMMSFGVALALILAFIAFPALLMLLPKPKIKSKKISSEVTKNLAKFTDRYGKRLLIVSATLFFISILGIRNLTVENRFIDYFKDSTEIYQGLSLIDNKLGGTTPLEIIFDEIAEDYWLDEYLREDLNKLHNYLDSLKITGKILSVDTLMQVLNDANNNKEISGFFLSIIKKNISEVAAKHILDPYISDKANQVRFVIRTKETDPNLSRKKLIQDVESFVINDLGFKSDSFNITGMTVLYNNMLQSLFKSQIMTMGTVFIAIYFMFSILFRSFSIALIAVIPNILPPTLILGFMGIVGIPLDLMTITIAAIAIGIGVDSAIHYIYRFRNEFKKDNNYLDAMYRSHATIGQSIFYTAITVIIGFLILVLSNFVPSIYFGLFTAIAMLSALLANLTLLPKLLVVFKPKLND